METTDLRAALHQYIDEGDDKLLRMLYAVAKEYNEEEEYEFTEEEIKELDEKVEEWRRGETKAYTWEEAKEIILKKQPVK